MKKVLVALLSVVMILGCLPLTAFAATGATFTVETVAANTSVVAGTEIEYTVYLDNSNSVDGGVWNIEFDLNIPTGLSYVNGSAVINSEFSTKTGIDGMGFNEANLRAGALGALSAGYTGEKVAIMTFKCKSESVVGNVTVSLKNACVYNVASDTLEAEVNVDKATVEVYVPHVCATPLTLVPEVPATCTDAGVKAYYVCADTDCTLKYSDAEGKKVVTDAELVIKALGHNYVNGICSRCGVSKALADIVNEAVAKLVLEATENEHNTADSIKKLVEEALIAELKAALGENYDTLIGKVEVVVDEATFQAAANGVNGKATYTIKVTPAKAADGTVGTAVEVDGTVEIKANEVEEVEEKKNGLIFPKLFNVTVDCGEGGSVNTSKTFKMAYGSTRTIKITADEGYEVADVIVNGKSVGAVEKYTIKGARTTYTVKVLFEEIEG